MSLTERIRQAAADATVTGSDINLRDEFEAFKEHVTAQLDELRNDFKELLAEFQSKLDSVSEAGN